MMTNPTRTTKTAAPVIPAIRRIASRDLFGAERELVIMHDAADYRLRITANNKLILTK